MKKMSPLLILLTLLSLTSCGQSGKTSATLKVSSSFALSNTGFDGGFVLYGKSGSQSFSKAVPYSASSTGNAVDIVLPNGKWTFYATAWKNQVSGPMTGDILCGETSADLVGLDTRVNLNVSQAACDSDSFVNETMKDISGPNKVKKLALISCNGLYEWSTGGPSRIVGNTTPYNFCSSSDVPLDFRNRARYFQIKAMNKSISHQVTAGGMTSPCLPFTDSAANGVSSVRETQFRIPSSNTPIQIDLFMDSGCTEDLSLQPMLEGLSFNYNTDKFFLHNAASTHGGFVIPSNESRKGYSHFISVLPNFKCSSNLCVAQHLTAPYEFYVPRTLGSSPVRLNLDYDPLTTSANYNVTIPAGKDWTFSGGSQAMACGKNDETFYCDLILDSDCSDPESLNCFSSHVSSPTFEVNFRKSGGTTLLKRVYVFKDRSDFAALKMAYRFTGILSNGPVISDDDHLDEEDHPLNGNYGPLDLPRMLLSPAIAGNVSFPGQTCASASGTRQLELREDGTTRTYELTVENNRDLGTGLNTFEKFFFCLSSAFNTGTCSAPDAPYEKRFTVRRLLGPGNWEKFFSMEFSCDPAKRSGRLHEENSEYHSGTNIIQRRERTVLAWFTPLGLDTERLEIYKGSRDFDTSGTETHYSSMFSRLYKTSSSNFEVNGMVYRRNYSGASYQEDASRYFIQLNTSFLQYDFLSIHKSNSVDGADIFNSGSPSEYEVDSEDIRPVLSRASVSQKMNLNLMTLTPGSYTYIGAGPTTTSLGNLPLRLESMKPTSFYGVFNDGFY